jgi:hypothetical protein
MRLGEINQATSRQSGPAPHGAEAAPAEPSATRRALVALVALAPAAASREAPQAYRQAPFLAHLLAMKDQHPQTRERRRAEPAEALAAYRVTAELAER